MLSVRLGWWLTGMPPSCGRQYGTPLPEMAMKSYGEVLAVSLIHKLGRTVAVPESLRANADDRLPIDPLGRVEGSDSIVEGRDLADVRPQPSVPHPLDDLTQ